jgi:hypothetical protein
MPKKFTAKMAIAVGILKFVIVGDLTTVTAMTTIAPAAERRGWEFRQVQQSY